MPKTRREFLSHISIPLLTAAAGCQMQGQKPAEPPAGAPPAFGTSPPAGPEVSPITLAEAEKLVRVEMTPSDRSEAVSNWRSSMAALYELRTGPRKVFLQSDLAPGTQWDPVLPGMKAGPERDRFIRGRKDAADLPARDEDIAFAPVTQLSRWIEEQKL